MGGVIVRSEQNEPSALASKLNPRNGDHGTRSNFDLIRDNFGGKKEWIDARESLLIDSTPPQSRAVKRVSNGRRSSNSNPSVFGQPRSEGLKRLLHVPGEASDMNVKLVLGPHKA